MVQPINLYWLTLVKITKARILKPRVDFKEVCKPYSHIAPELHGGDRQSKASDVYSFGAKAQHV